MTTILNRGETVPLTLTTQQTRLDAIRGLKDASERAEAASELARVASDEAKRLRTARDQAVTALHITHGVKPVKVYKAAHVGRSSFHKIVERNVTRDANPLFVKDPDKAWDAIEKSATVYREWAKLSKSAQQIRNDATKGLMSTWTNKELAELTGLSSVRVSQLKNGRGRKTPAA